MFKEAIVLGSEVEAAYELINPQYIHVCLSRDPLLPSRDPHGS